MEFISTNKANFFKPPWLDAKGCWLKIIAERAPLRENKELRLTYWSLQLSEFCSAGLNSPLGTELSVVKNCLKINLYVII